MTSLPSTSIAARLNAFVAAAVVTLALAAGIDGLALAHGTAQPLAQAVGTPAA